MNKMHFVVKALIVLISVAGASCGTADVHKAAHVDSYQKPGASVRVSAPEHEAVGVGETAALNFTLSSPKPGVAEISVRADDGLVHDLPDSLTVEFSDGSIVLPVNLSATAEGRYYLYLSISMDGRSRNVSYGQSFGDEKAIAEMTRLKVSQPAAGGIKRYKAEETINEK